MTASIRPLGDVSDIIAGQHIEAALYSDVPGGSPYLTGPADFGERHPVVSKWTHSPKVFGAKGDVFVTVKGAGVGKINMGCDAAIGRQLMAVRPRAGQLDQAYLFHSLRAVQARISGLSQGATVPGIGKDDLSTLRLHLPPLAEQKRIAAVLDKADDLRAKRQHALATLDTLLQSVFLDMFGDPVTNPKGWPVRPAGDIGTVQGGLTLNQRRRELSLTASYLRVANVQRGFIDTTEMKSIGLTPEERERTALQSGDLLVVEGNGNPREIGRAAVWDGSIADCVHQNHLIRIRPDPASLTSAYAVAFVNSDGGMRYFNRAGNTTSGLVTINISVVRNIPFPVPPIDLQRRYSRSIASLNDQRRRIEDSLAQMDALFATLQSAAFTGTLFDETGTSNSEVAERRARPRVGAATV